MRRAATLDFQQEQPSHTSIAMVLSTMIASAGDEALRLPLKINLVAGVEILREAEGPDGMPEFYSK
jgi:hypothetical protein